MSDDFVGRRKQLAEIDAEWAAAVAGRPRVVWVSGEAGMGKSALVREWLLRREPVGRSFVATADEAERDLEFALIQQLGLCAVDPQEDPLSAGADLVQALGVVSGDGPMVLVVDDAHDGDAPSLRALSFALRRLRADPVLTIVAARPVPLPASALSLGRLADGQGHRVEVEGLTTEEVTDFAEAAGRGHLPLRAATRLRAHTGGSPLHVRALCHELTSAELRAPQLPAPRSFSLLVASSLADLPVQAQDVARACAVLGERVAAGVAARLSGVRDVLSAADQLAEAGLVRVANTDKGWELRWVHPMVRTAVYDDLGAVERLALHRKAAAVTHGVASVEHLVAAAIDPDEQLAARLEHEADAAAEAGRWRVSARLLLHAHKLSVSSERSAARLLDGVDRMLMCGDVSGVLPLAQAVALLPESAASLHTRARLTWMSGDPSTAKDLGQRSWTLTRPEDARLRVSLATMLSQIEILEGHAEAGLGWPILALTTPSLTRAQRSACTASAVLALAMKGEIDQARARLSDLPDDPSAVPLERHGELRARGFARMVGDDLQGATRDLLTVAAALRVDPTPERLVALGGAAEAQFRSGDWPSSLVNAEQAVSLAEDSEQVWALGFLHTPPVLVLAGQGRWTEAEHHLARAAELAAVVKDEATSAYVADVRVHLDLCRGDAAAAEEHGRPIRLRRARAPWEPGVMRLPVNYTTALVHLGRLEEAAALLQRLEERARATHRLSTLCALTRVRGELAAARRDTAAARAAFDEAIDLIGAADALEAGLVRLAHGRFRRRRGERRGAEEEFNEAREAFGRLGALPWIERTDAELALLGGHRLRAAAPGKVDPLTPQERLVAELVCGGRTNQMVAEELVLSVKTVSYHLSNVYLKLNVHSRTQLAAHPGMRSRRPDLD